MPETDAQAQTHTLVEALPGWKCYQETLYGNNSTCDDSKEEKS